VAGSSVQINSAGGTRLATNSYTEGGVTVHDEKTILGEPYTASYVLGFAAISIATSADHVLQIMAGSSLNVRIRRIRLYQLALAGTASTTPFIIHRLSTAGTGGTAVGARAVDSGDAAAGMTAMTLPTVKGTEGNFFYRWTMGLYAAHPIVAPAFEWVQLPNSKPFIIPAGTTNGMAIKVTTGVASATISGWVEADETSF
jgi:hypothetical protein